MSHSHEKHPDHASHPEAQKQNEPHGGEPEGAQPEPMVVAAPPPPPILADAGPPTGQDGL